MTAPIETIHLDDIVENYAQDMAGKTVAITGTTSGTGYVCAREVARKGALVLLLNRDSDRATRSLHSLREEVPDGHFNSVSCDLQDFDSVRDAAREILEREERLDVLCNNAGVMAMPDIATRDGYDVQMQTNCLSHFLLTRMLFPLLRQSDQGRVVNHTSQARLGGPLIAEYFGRNGGNLGGDGTEEENTNFAGPRWERYHQTKLANCAFTYGLKEKLESSGIENVRSILAHPGLAATQLQLTTVAAGGMEANSPLMAQAQSSEDGATGIIRACMDPTAESGDFFGPEDWGGFPVRLTPEPLLTDAENIRINWEGCEAATGQFSF